MKKIILFLMVVVLVSVITITILTIVSRQKRTQQGASKSLQEGFGYYGEEVSLGCFSETGKCTDQGIETFVQDCKPHPETGRGCIDENGNHTYNTNVKTRPCNVQCVASKFASTEAVGLTDISQDSLQRNVTRIGCNNIIDKKLGTDYTGYFFENFNTKTNKNSLKSCIPSGPDSQFQGYYQRTLTCSGHDDKGTNGCVVICGNDQNILNLTGLTSAKLNRELLNYFPQEFNEEGEIRNVCYDINNVDQIEILNYPGTVPKDFVYPNKCYKHTNTLKFNENLWPTSGTSNIFPLNEIQTEYNVSYIDINGDNLTNFDNHIIQDEGGIVSANYDLNTNQQSYVKARVGSNNILIDKIFKTSNTGVNQGSLVSRILYLSFTSSDFDNLVETQGFPYSSQNWNVEINGSTQSYTLPNISYYQYDVNSGVKDFVINKDNYLYIPVDYSDYFEKYTNINTIISGNNTIIQGLPALSSSDFYCYMINRNLNNGIRQHVFQKGTYTGTSFTFENFKFESFNPVIEEVYLLNNNNIISAITSDYEVPVQIYQGNNLSTAIVASIDFSRSVITNNVFMNSFGTSVPTYSSVQLKKNVSEDGPYSVLGTPEVNQIPSYYYPLYQKQINDDYIAVNFFEFPNVNFYVNKNLQITQNDYYRPTYFGTSLMINYNEETLFSSQSYKSSYINFDGVSNYFFSDLETITLGTSYESGQLYYLYSEEKDASYTLNQSLSNIGSQIPAYSAIYVPNSQNINNRILRILRGNDKLVIKTNGEREPASPEKKKVSEYFQMIENQAFITDGNSNLIIEPEREIRETANYEVFKSPYIYEQNNKTKNFICYSETGRALEKGTRVELTPGSGTVFINLRCPTTDVSYQLAEGVNPDCGFQGVSTPLTGSSVQYCRQERNEVERNFNSNCIITTLSGEYNTLNNQYAHGFQLNPIVKSTEYNQKINNDVLTFPTYFTKKYSQTKIYQPSEEFFTELLQNNYYVSITDNNQSFVDNIESWRRIFPQEVNSYSNPFQYFFDSFPKNFSTDNGLQGLGKYGTSTLTGDVSDSSNLNVSYNTTTSGIKSQNYLNQGVTFYHGNPKRNMGAIPNTQTAYNAIKSVNNDPNITSSFIGRLKLSNNRIPYDSSTFTSTPLYNSIKFQSPLTNGSAPIEGENPVLAQFDIVQTDKYYFSCKFFDSNFDVPWNSNPVTGDFFCPDFTLFNSFFYSYFFSGPEQTIKGVCYQEYGVIGTDAVTKIGNSDTGSWSYLQKYTLHNPHTGVTNNLSLFNDSSAKTFTIETGSPFNTPEVSDYLIYVPYEPFTLKNNAPPTSGVPTNTITIGGDFPICYPTLQIKRVSELTPNKSDSNGNITEYQITLEDKDYSNSSPGTTIESLDPGPSFVIMNLGQGTTVNNLIDRNFKILTLAEEEIRQTVYSALNQGGTSYSYNFSKKYIEFFFSIDSISQDDMHELYALNVSRKQNTLTVEGKFSTEYGADDYLCTTTGRPCYGPGCMPGNADANAQCYKYLNSKGYYDITCGAPKWWYCPDKRNPTPEIKVNQYLTETLNPLVPALSARYVRSSFQSPYQQISTDKFACLSNSLNQDINNTKVMSQSTRITKYSGYYYINEFRENTDFFTKLEERAFKVGDTFDYYNSNNGPETLTVASVYGSDDTDMASGNKSFTKVLSLRVLEVEVVLEGSGGEIIDIYDYKCETITQGTSINPFQYNQFSYGSSFAADISTLANIQVGQQDSVYKSFFMYQGDLNFGNTGDFDYQLPYTVISESGVVRRVMTTSITAGMSISYTNQKSIGRWDTYGTGTASKDNIFLDYYKFSDTVMDNEYLQEPNYGLSLPSYIPYVNFRYPVYLNFKTASTVSGAINSLMVSTIYSGEAIRAGILDIMVLTGTTLESSEGQTCFANLVVSGKPYGSEYFLSEPENSQTNINRNAFGRVESFTIQDVNFPVGTILRSGKGFNIEFTLNPPTAYSIDTSQSPSNKILPFQEDFIYSENDIVNYKNMNVRQYFRNISGFAIPYMKVPDINSPIIPYCVGDSDLNYYYPVYLSSSGNRTETITIDKNKFYYNPDDFVNKNNKNESNFMDFNFTEQVKLAILLSFEIVPKTVYPENNFVSYSPEADYTVGEVVSFFNGNETALYKSLKKRNVGNDPLTATDWWSLDSLQQNLVSSSDNDFYKETVEGNDYSKYIQDVKYLNDQNLPALIRRFSDRKENCPELCTFADVNQDYKSTFLDTEYFDNIRYLFLDPVILENTSNGKVVSLGNTPVQSSKYYDTKFLEDGGSRKDFLTQRMYYIDIEGQQDRYNKPDCTGNLFITNEGGPSVNTEVDKFTFANSILFDFLPCDLESQDFIKYKVKSGASSGTTIVVEALDEYPSTQTPNIFPPTLENYNIIVSSKNGTCFQSLTGSFNYTHLNAGDTTEASTDITLNGAGGPQITVSNIKSGSVFATHTTTVSGTGEYGDIWYDQESGSSGTYPFGFLVPENLSTGFIGARSFMQLNRNYQFSSSETVQFIPNRTITGPNQGENSIISFDISFNSSQTYTAGMYYKTASGPSFFFEVYDNQPLSQKEATVQTSITLEDAEYVYFPTYDINSNIKAKAVCVFGENYIADMKYTLDKKDSVLSLNNQLLSTSLFTEFRNDLFLNDQQKRKGTLFSGVSSSSIDNMMDTFIINFNSENFSIKPNPFEKPITSATNRLLYDSDSTVQLDVPLGCVNTESTTSLISSGMSTLKGTSVLLSFSDFANFNQTYTSNGTCIPGRTNIQVQFSEIRQNRTSDYIQENNMCSVYFQPLVGSNTARIVTSEWKMLYSPGLYPMYSEKTTGGRFYAQPISLNGGRSKFYFEKSETNLNILDDKEPVTVYLGCNLYYKFSQEDSSNPGPVVFSKNKYSATNPFSKTDIIIGDQKFTIQYYLNGEEVSYDNYSSKFGTTTDRYVEIRYQSDFDDVDFTNAKIYYGLPITPFYKAGGLIQFKYH